MPGTLIGSQDPNALKKVLPDSFTEKTPVQPTVFIGLGGTGAEVLLRLRRKHFEKLLTPHHPCVRYVYIDCDTGFENVALGDPKSAPIRSHIAFGDGEKVLATVPPDFFTALKHQPGQYEYVLSWLPPALPASIDRGANGIRPIGRLTFFVAENFRKITSAIEGAYNQLTEVRNADGAMTSDASRPRFVVVGSLAGGTGSGLFLDIGFWLRYKYGTGHDIEGIFLLPEVFSDTADGSRLDDMRAGAYAALKELEFYHERMDHVFDKNITAATQASRHDYKARWQSRKDRASDIDPIPAPAYTLVALVDGKNDAGQNLGKSEANRRSLFEMIADYLYWDQGQSAFSSAVRMARDNLIKSSQACIFKIPYARRDRVTKEGEEVPNWYTDYFSARYVACGIAKVSFPMARVLYLCAYNLSADILDYWMFEVPQPPDLSRRVIDMAKKKEELGFSSELLFRDMLTKGKLSLKAELAERERKCFQGFQGAIATGIPRQTLEEQCALLRDYVSREDDSPGDARLIIQGPNGNETHIKAEWGKNIEKWIGDLAGRHEIRADGATRVCNILAEVLKKTAEKETAASHASFDAAAGEKNNLQKTLTFYEDTLTGWNAHPLRARTLARLARRAIGQAARQASLMMDGYGHESCARVIAHIVNSLAQFQTNLTDFRGRIAAMKREIENQRDAVDEMKSGFFFELDLYKKGEYREYYKLGGEPMKDHIRENADEFLRSGSLSVAGMVGDLCMGRLTDLSDKLFTFSRKKFQDLTGAKDCLTLLMERGGDGGWQKRVDTLLQIGRPWIRKGSKEAQSDSGVLPLTVVGLPRSSPRKDEFEKYLMQHGITQFHECDDPGSIVILAEKGRFPLTYMDGIEKMRDCYLARMLDGDQMGQLHLSPAFANLPDIMAKSDDDVQTEVLCRMRVLQGIILGKIKRDEVNDSSGRRTRLTYRYLERNIEETKIFFGEDSFTTAIVKQAWLRDLLEHDVDSVLEDFKLEKRQFLLKILTAYLTKTFPSVELRVAGTQERGVVDLNRAAIQSWYDDCYEWFNGQNLPDPNPEHPPTLKSFAVETKDGYWCFMPSVLASQ